MSKNDPNEVTFADVLAAQQEALWAPAPRTYRRTCNTCGGEFESSGTWMCPPCQTAQPDPFAAFDDDERTKAIPVETMAELVNNNNKRSKA